MPVPFSIEDIPTLAEQYEDGTLPFPSPLSQTKYVPNPTLNRRVSVWRGDITKLKTDMIVNAANMSLLGGGGVDGAIHAAAGPKLLDECETLGGAETGETKVTDGYNLPAKRIAHTVGPIYSSHRSEECAAQLESCYATSLAQCSKYGGGSIGFSNISTGVYGYPMDDATRIALDTTRKFLEEDSTITRVIYVVFSQRDLDVYLRLVPEYFPPDGGIIS